MLWCFYPEVNMTNSEDDGAPVIGTIIGIDPGSTRLGVSIFRFNVVNLKIISVKAFTINLDKVHRNDWLVFQYGDRVARLRELNRIMLNIFIEHEPDVVVSESPFMNMRRPAAFEALIETMCEIRQALITYDPCMRLLTIDPSSIKNAVGEKGNAGKEEIKQAVSKLEEIVLEQPIETMSEHAIDSLAVAYTQFKRYRAKRGIQK